MFKLILYLVIGYFLFRFVSAFLSGLSSKGNERYREHVRNEQQTRRPSGNQKGEYVDFEEIKPE